MPLHPDVGDRLYGTPARRLMLHAARLTFETYDFHDDTFLMCAENLGL